MKRIFTPAKKTTILIVDDDRVVAHIYREKFQSQGFKVEVAGDGAAAIQKLQEVEIDLVILDLCLPGMTGVEVLKNIRAESTLRTLPIIVFSNSYLSSLERKALEAGATKCVTKAESTPSDILVLVRELLAAPQSEASEALAAESAPEFREEVLATLLASAPETLAKLRAGLQVISRPEAEALQQAELSGMHRLVRSLAVSAGLVGFRKISQTTNALEALLIELHAKPKKLTPSVIRTIAQAIDIIGSLFEATHLETEVVEPARVLVVDDEIISRETVCSALGKANLTAVSLDDSVAAQTLLEQEHFDLIFLDVEMPGQSGFELCVKIREMATNHATPVVFVTAHADFGRRVQSSLSGGNEFIAKPFLLVELAVKALTCLFKESPRVPAPASAPADGVVLNLGEDSTAALAAAA